MTTHATTLALTIAAVALTPPAAARGPLQDADELPASPDSIELRLDVSPELPVIVVEADLTLRANQDLTTVDVFLRPDANLNSIADATGNPLDYRRRRDRVRVITPRLKSGSETTWTFRYRLRTPASLRDAKQFLSTSPWYPHFRYPAAELEYTRYVPMRTRISATLPRPWMLVAPGVRTEDEDGDKVTYTWTDSVPTPQLPLVIGNFEEQTRSREARFFRCFFPPGRRPLAAPYVDYLAEAATFFSEYIGSLPRRNFSVVALQLPEGISGVTVAGMTFLEVRVIHPNQPFPYRVLAHEVAHYWWNYEVKIPRSRDGWLREGLPTYSALLFLEHDYGAAIMRQELERSRRVALSVNSEEPLGLGFGLSSPEVIYAFNYHKATFVLHMLRQVMGLDGFSALLRDLYELRSDVTTEVFRAEAEKIYGADLSWFFDAWLDRGAVPSFTVRYRYDPDESGPLKLYRLHGVIEQQGAAIRYPVLIRVPLVGAPPLEQTVWVEPGTTEFSISLPSPPSALQFDPHGDLLTRSVTIENLQQPAGRSGLSSPW